MENVILALGSNLGDRAQQLDLAKTLVEQRAGKIVRCSKVYETEAWGFEGKAFLNQVIVIETEAAPLDLLDTLQSIEKEMGRKEKSSFDDKTQKAVYHNRRIDIDILLYGDQCFRSPRLSVPHPLIAERRFVLEPLTELFQDQIVPPFHTSFKTLLSQL